MATGQTAAVLIPMAPGDASAICKKTAVSARVNVLGVPFAPLTFAQALDALVALARGSRPAYAVTANVDHVVRFNRCPGIRSIYTRADLVLADGVPLIWASRFLGPPLPERVAGSDLFPALCQRAAGCGLSVFLLGGSPGTARRAADIMSRRHRGLRVAGTHCPPFGFENDSTASEEALSAVRSASPDVLFVALGSPKQEQWIVKNLAAHGAKLSIGVGISFSFVTGDVIRAPRWMQRAGLEWAHRLAQEPGRLWKRYLLEDSAFLILVLRCLLKRSPGRMQPDPNECE